MKYILVMLNNSLFITLLSELQNDDRVTTYLMNYPLKNPFLQFIRRVHTSAYLSQYIHLPYKGIWYRDLKKTVTNDSCLILTTEILSKIDLGFFRDIRKIHPSCKFVLLVMDSMHAHSLHMKYARPKILKFSWDIALSFDRNDCEEFGFTYMGGSFYTMYHNLTPDNQISDLYYIGYAVGNRPQMVFDIYDKLNPIQIKCNFGIAGYKGTYKRGINFFKKSIPYVDVVRGVLSTNCILEILQEGQQAQTARYYEAVCYNKKLLSNNPNLTKLKFYNPRYMHYFKDIKDIDPNWIKKKENINYYYKDEFSPIHILEIIENKLSNKK